VIFSIILFLYFDSAQIHMNKCNALVQGNTIFIIIVDFHSTNSEQERWPRKFEKRAAWTRHIEK